MSDFTYSHATDESHDNIILIDWFCFTTKAFDDINDVVSWLGLTDVAWADTKGHYGYKSAKSFGGMWIMYDGREDMGICVEMSGQGCRQYETSGVYDLDCLVHLVAQSPDVYHITRLDVAFDDVDKEGDGLLDMSVIDNASRTDMYISKFRSKSGEWSGKHSANDIPNPLALSVYFGSAQSNVRFRIYDKALERGGLDYHWTRFELQLRDKAALAFLSDIAPVGIKYYGLINNNLRFIVPNDTDSNRRRWESPEWWTRFLQTTQKISVYTKKEVDYNMSRLEHYVFDQAGKSIYTYIKCKGLMAFWQYMLEYIEGKDLNDNQLKLIDEYATINEQKLLKYYRNQPTGRLSHYHLKHPDKGN